MQRSRCCHTQAVYKKVADICYNEDKKSTEIPQKIKNGRVEILLSHPESLLSEEGRKLLKSKIYLENVVAIVVDEAHCIDLW